MVNWVIIYYRSHPLRLNLKNPLTRLLGHFQQLHLHIHPLKPPSRTIPYPVESTTEGVKTTEGFNTTRRDWGDEAETQIRKINNAYEVTFGAVLVRVNLDLLKVILLGPFIFGPFYIWVISLHLNLYTRGPLSWIWFCWWIFLSNCNMGFFTIKPLFERRFWHLFPGIEESQIQVKFQSTFLACRPQ